MVVLPGTDEWTDGELRDFAQATRDFHDPAMQEHAYARCERCGFTRHPCDTYDLADSVITLLNRIEAMQEQMPDDDPVRNHPSNIRSITEDTKPQ